MDYRIFVGNALNNRVLAGLLAICLLTTLLVIMYIGLSDSKGRAMAIFIVPATVIACMVTHVLLLYVASDYVTVYEQNKQSFVIENAKNELIDYRGDFLIGTTKIFAITDEKTKYIKDKESKIVVEKVSYSIKPAWYVKDEAIKFINSKVDYYIKEVHQKS